MIIIVIMTTINIVTTFIIGVLHAAPQPAEPQPGEQHVRRFLREREQPVLGRTKKGGQQAYSLYFPDFPLNFQK